MTRGQRHSAGSLSGETSEREGFLEEAGSATHCRHGGSVLVGWRRKVLSSQACSGCRGSRAVHVLAPARPWLLSCHPALLRMLCPQADNPALLAAFQHPWITQVDYAWKSLLYVSKCQDHNCSSRSGSHRLPPPREGFPPSLPPGSLFPAECPPQHFSLMTVTLLCSSHGSSILSSITCLFCWIAGRGLCQSSQ